MKRSIVGPDRYNLGRVDLLPCLSTKLSIQHTYDLDTWASSKILNFVAAVKISINLYWE